MKKLLLKSMWVLLLLATQAYGQTRTITGTVTGKDDGSPIPGASVVIKGTKTGTQTSSDGKFSLSTESGTQTLVVSFIGYLPQTVRVSGSTVSIVLEPDQKQLSEVLVVGYGTQTKRDNVGSIAQIKGKDLVEQPVQSFEQSLAGKAPGVQITIPNGVLNTPPVFHIRGINSISLSSQPLIIVDGVPSFTGDLSGGESGGNALANINPDDIESIDVAKDASATAIYGSRAANGVVFVTTKKGKKGSSVVSVDSWVGVTKVNRLPSVLDAYQYVALKNEALVNSNQYNATSFYAGLFNGPDGSPINTNWAKLLYRTGTSYNSTVSVSGGSDKTSYYFSANYSKQAGVLVKNDYNSKGALFNIDHKANKIITIGAKLSYADQQNLAALTSGSLPGEAYNSAGLGRLALLLPSNISPYNNDGSYNLNGSTIGLQGNKGLPISYPNPQPMIDLDRANNEQNHIASNVYLQLNPLKWITLKTVYGIDYIYSTNDIFTDPVEYPPGAGTDNYTQYKRSIWDNTAQFDYSIAKHSVSLLLGNEQQRGTTYGFGLSRSNLSDPAFNQIQSGYTINTANNLVNSENYLVSFFGRFNYDFDKKYFLTATLRKDGYSAFGPDSKYGYFPGLGLGWEVAKEKFWTSIGADKIFSTFKLKASVGRVGNNSGLNDFASYGFYSNGLYNGNATLSPTQTGNTRLSWETSNKLDLGLDYGILNDRISGSIGYYKDDITGLIFNVPTAPSAGLASNPPVNIGSMYNKGIEFDINAQILNGKGFTWSSNFNISYNVNQITSLIPGVNSFTYSTSSLETANINQVGSSVGALYIVKTAGVDPATGRRIFINGAGKQVYYAFYSPNNIHYTYADGTTAPAINQSADAVNYGSTSPKFYGGFTNTFHYKGIDLNVLLTYQLGMYVYYGTAATLTDQRYFNNSTDILDHWTTPGQIARYPKVVYGDNVSNGTSFPTDFNVYSGNFLKVKTVNLGYTLPSNLLKSVGISSVRLYVTGQNLLIFTKYPGPDPEVASNGTVVNSTTNGNSTGGVDRNTAANGRTITAGFSLKF
jgi:TonB-linked SusC/RagA family outer membrane protein